MNTQSVRPPLVAGNWKMFGLTAQIAEAQALAALVAADPASCDVALCPPATLLAPLRSANLGPKVLLGGQTCHAAAQGAHTGDVSAPMLKDAGAQLVIVGHSERRANHGETSAAVAAQANAAFTAGLEAVVCIGETLEQNEAGQTLSVLTAQLAGSIPADLTLDEDRRLTIAYEPVWAIGTGRTPTLDDVARLHAVIKGWLSRRFGAQAAAVRVLYGGSVKPDNAAGILALPGVDGALVGGASLKAADFNAIIGCYR